MKEFNIKTSDRLQALQDALDKKKEEEEERKRNMPSPTATFNEIKGKEYKPTIIDEGIMLEYARGMYSGD